MGIDIHIGDYYFPLPVPLPVLLVLAALTRADDPNPAPRACIDGTGPGWRTLTEADFAGSAERLERIALELRPRAIGFVGKEAYRGAFGERPELGLQERRLGETALFVLPSTSPANAAVPWQERLRWFQAFFDAVSTKGASTTSQPPS